MAWGVNEIENILLTVFSSIHEAYCMCFYSNATLPLEVHGIEDLIHHLTLAECAGPFQKPVSERRFPMVNMGDNGEITYILVSHPEVSKAKKSCVLSLKKSTEKTT